MTTAQQFGSEQAADALALLDVALDELASVGFDGLSALDNVGLLRRLEQVTRRAAAIGSHVIRAVDDASVEDLAHLHTGPVLADALRISGAEAAHRVRVARELTPACSLTGQQMEPVLPATASVADQGLIGDGHVRVIEKFVKLLPSDVSVDDSRAAEATLARYACEMRPDDLKKVAIALAAYLNPDGDADDRYRARMRGITIGAQRQDLLSKISGYLTPELRALLEPVLAKLALPGMANPDDEHPVVEGEPTDDGARRDPRTGAQRNHDAFVVMCRELLASGKLGQHRGLPVTMVVTTTLDQLTDAMNQTPTGPAMTGGGAFLPMRDVIRMGSQSRHYLAVFDGHSNRPLYLGRAKRLATADQRLMLFAKDRGCSFPGCDKGGYWSQAHHLVHDWADGGETNIDELTFADEHHHGLNDKGWKTVQTRRHRTGWIPPKIIDPQQKPRINHTHHPEDQFRS